jgi:SAM-dependent methyltransferase
MPDTYIFYGNEKRSERKMKILDATCGSKTIWYQKNHPLVTFMDKREGKYYHATEINTKEIVRVNPNIVADWTKILPFDNNEFDMIVFDPPHIISSTSCEMTNRYGRLNPSSWRKELKKGIKELFRVLKPNGVFILKWAETSKPLEDVLKLFPYKPMFGTRTGQANKNHWVLFIKYRLEKELDIR